MKRIFITFFIMILLFSNFAFANTNWNKINKMQEKLANDAVASLLEPYMSEDVAEVDRIIAYDQTGYGTGTEKENGIFSATASFDVIPFLEEGSNWTKNKRYMCFIKFEKGENEYIVKDVSLYPDNYDKFLERFEEWKQNKESTEYNENLEKTENIETKETVIISSGEEKLFEAKNEKFIIKMNIYGICIIMIIISIILIEKSKKTDKA